MKRVLLIILGTAAILASAAPAAGAGYHGWGLRAGPSSGPDAIHLGAHLDDGNFAYHFRR